MVDQYLLLHIPLAVLWALLVGVQLWSGQVRGRKQLHITFGWLGLATGVVGIGVIGGWIWPMDSTVQMLGQESTPWRWVLAWW